MTEGPADRSAGFNFRALMQWSDEELMNWMNSVVIDDQCYAKKLSLGHNIILLRTARRNEESADRSQASAEHYASESLKLANSMKWATWIIACATIINLAVAAVTAYLTYKNLNPS
jgi:hypothetical protein